eukprot:10607659-Heterocapsa_arctica.AAC.1
MSVRRGRACRSLALSLPFHERPRDDTWAWGRNPQDLAKRWLIAETADAPLRGETAVPAMLAD